MQCLLECFFVHTVDGVDHKGAEFILTHRHLTLYIITDYLHCKIGQKKWTNRPNYQYSSMMNEKWEFDSRSWKHIFVAGRCFSYVFTTLMLFDDGIMRDIQSVKILTPNVAKGYPNSRGELTQSTMNMENGPVK